MPLPFDATLKEIAQASPRAFLAAFDAAPSLPVSLLNVDLSTVTTSADLVFGLGEPLQEIIHVDCQASASADLHRDVLAYNALLHRRFALPVHSIVVLLRRQAAHANVTGALRYEPRPGRGRMDFGYEVVRLWEHPVEPILTGDLGTVPLAPLCQLPEGVSTEEGLAGVIHQVIERLLREAPERGRKLLTAAYVLTGARVPRDIAYQLFQGVRAMRESDTYMAILEEGGTETAQRILLRQGRKRFGETNAATEAAVKAITDLPRLERLCERLLDVSSWQELLDLP